MQFLLLLYHDEGRWAALSDDVRAAVYGDYRAFVKEMADRGAWLQGGECEQSASARVVRVREGQTIASSLSFDPAREQLAGYFVIEAADMAAAMEIAAKLPGARDGLVEIRGIRGT
jgi:hypothetical protein